MTIGPIHRKEKLPDGHMSEAKYGAVAIVNPRSRETSQVQE
jgi:hypothetical protein